MKARQNPFRTEKLAGIRYRLQGVEWSGLLARFVALGRRGAIVGAHGTGKTTLLEDLATRLRDGGWRTRMIRCDAEHPKLPPGLLGEMRSRGRAGEILLFDGAEQLGPLAWWRFLRATAGAGGLVITTHRPGRLPTLHECFTSPALLAEIAEQLLEKTEAAGVRSTAERLFRRHQGNLREALREWYDELAHAASPQARPP